MRKLVPLLLVVLLILGFTGLAQAEPSNITEALATANNEIRDKNFGADYFFKENIQGKPINEELWAKSRVFSYGTPKEASKGSNDFDPGTNQYRYHGYTRNGEKYTNTFFRNDTTETIDINKANWIRFPWEKQNIKNFVVNVMHEPPLEKNNPFNNDPNYLKSILYGMENLKMYNPYMQFKKDNKQWQEYVHILQPPTQYSFGMGRMFRLTTDGRIGYLTIPLTPFSQTVELDFATDIPATKINDAKPGEKVTEKISFTLNTEYTKPVKAIVTVFHEVGENRFLVNLEAIDSKNDLPENQVIEFQPGEKKEYWATITVQNRPSYLASYILPITNPDEVKPSDLYAVPGILEEMIKEQKGGGN